MPAKANEVAIDIREFAKATGGLCKLTPMAGFRLRLSMALYFLVIPVPLDHSFPYHLRSMAKQA